MNADMARMLKIMHADLNLDDKALKEALYRDNAHHGYSGDGLWFQGMGCKGIQIDQIGDNRKRKLYTWAGFVKLIRQAQKEDETKGDLKMTESMVKPETFDPNTMALREIEIRIDQHARGIMQNYLEIGRCINEAKDRKLVPHGRWAAWATAYTGMEIRTIQRLMQAAREVPAGSALERLPLSKVTALLALPDPETREELATKAADESLTVKQLKAEIAELTREKKSQEQNAKELADIAESLERKAGRQADMMEKMDADRAAMRARIAELESNIGNLIQSQNEVINDEVAQKVRDKVAKLQEELAEARAYAAQQAELRQQAQQEMLNASVASAMGMEGMRPFGPYELECAVRSFLGEAGVMAHMGAELGTMSNSDRKDMRQCLNRLEDWLVAARQALDTVVIVNG